MLGITLLHSRSYGALDHENTYSRITTIYADACSKTKEDRERIMQENQACQKGFPEVEISALSSGYRRFRRRKKKGRKGFRM